MPSVGPAAVRGSDPAALAFAMHVKDRASRHSFARLETFGRAAMHQPTHDNMAKLQHVTITMIELREYDQAVAWNEHLRNLAKHAKDNDYKGVADINAMLIAHLRDGAVTPLQADAMMARYRVGPAGQMARVLKARMLVDDMKSAAAITLLTDLLRALPQKGDADGSIRAHIWYQIGLAHSSLDDVRGYVSAMRAVENEIDIVGYPWPSFEAIYHLALALGYVGRYEEANQATAIYSELAKGVNTPMRLAMAGNLCGYVAAARDDWAEVLRCYEPFGPDLNVPAPLDDVMRSRRAVGYARTGQVALAQKDLREIRRRMDAGQLSFSPSVHRAEAEVMIASGDYKRGVKALRDYHLNQFRTVTQISASVMSDIVGDMETELREANKRSEERARTIVMLWCSIAAVAVLVLGLIILLMRQRHMAKALERATERERAENEQRAQFFVDISHEIRTPLNGVVAMADALRKENLPHDVAEKVRLIATSSETLDRLLSDVLDNAKMEAGELSVEAEVFNLAQLVRDIEALWRDKAESKSLKLSLDSNLGCEHWVRGDVVRLGQVLNNLLSNALKFTPQGRILFNVLKVSDQRCLFVVTDTGIGFDELEEGSIFERYRQADGSISRRFGGTGLGLSISYKLVEMMGGTLNAASKLGQGSQFWFTLPLTKTAPPQIVQETALMARNASDVLRVLIVDDNATNRTILGMLLKSDAYQLHYASNGLEAVNLAQTIKFDVILMDIQMPVMDGLEAIRQIRTHEGRTGEGNAAIVIFSANDSAEDHRRGSEAGADGYISKPIVLERLLEEIDSAILIRARRANSANVMNINLR